MRYSTLSLCSAVVSLSAAFAVAQSTSAGSATQASASAERQTTGTVEMKTPDEIVLGTDAGLQHFAITAETERPLDFAKGDEVDLWYLPEANGQPARVTRIAHSTKAKSATRVASTAAPAPVTAPPVETGQAPAPAPAPPAHHAMTHPAAAAPPATRTGHLPKTASDLPLIGLLGLVSLAGAGVVRAIRLG
ncbi:MAG: hypothetical protein ACM3O7_06530 [Acidobacteriota bacterium]